jgi:hypothetical protein
MALTTEQKIGVNANFDRTTLDTYKDADGDPLKSAVFIWQIRNQDDASATFGATSTCALIVGTNGTPVGEGYINLGIGSLAISTVGVLYIKTAAAGTDTWVVVGAQT